MSKSLPQQTTPQERYERHARDAERVVRKLCADPTFTMPKWDELSAALRRHWMST